MKYNLVGIDGNAFNIMAYVANAMKREGKSKAEVDAYYKDAKSSDYDHLLYVSFGMIEKLNDENGYSDDDDEYDDFYD